VPGDIAYSSHLADIMDALNRETLVAARQWRDAGYRVVLATVTHTWGSSPRPVGSVLGVREDGLVRGSVSGGCIEDDLIHRMIHGGLALAAPQCVSYGLDADEAHQYGLPCGGTLELLLEPLLDVDWITRVLDACASGTRVARELDLKTGAVRIRAAHRDEGLALSADTLTAVYGPRYRLLIIGAGDMSAFLAQIALKLDYDVMICDPRVEYTAEFDVPGVAVVDSMPDDTVVAMKPDSHTAIVTLTHDPKLDDLALMEALKSDAFYVGAIGSRRNNDNRRDRLALFDVSREQLQRLRGPVGLPIGSKTPFEIAISIAAELTAVKNGVQVPCGQPITKSKEASAS
jgi:xanthine dehydrogenase accessory factor